MTGLSSMSGLTASRANVTLVVVGAVATPGKLPVKTYCRLVGSGDQFVVDAAQCKGGGSIPCSAFVAVVDGVLVMAQT